jgi:predicted HicB family RNase H-like nuclease
LSTYIKFLVRDLDADLLRLMRIEARHKRLSLAEHMRQILCSHFELDCKPSRARPRRKTGATTILLALQPELWQAVKDESAHLGVSMQTIVREALEAPYREEKVA